jgi:hypothetical protein
MTGTTVFAATAVVGFAGTIEEALHPSAMSDKL